MPGDGRLGRNLYVRVNKDGKRSWEDVGRGSNIRKKWEFSIGEWGVKIPTPWRRRAVYVRHKCTDGKRRYVRVGSVRNGAFRPETPKGKSGDPDLRLFKEKRYGTKAENRRRERREPKDRYWE